MSLFGKDPEPAKDDAEKRAKLDQDLAAVRAREAKAIKPLEDDAQVDDIDYTLAEHRVHGTLVLGSDRSVDDRGGVLTDPDTHPGTVHPHGIHPHQPVDQEVAVMTGDHGEVVEVHEVDETSEDGSFKKKKNRR